MKRRAGGYQERLNAYELALHRSRMARRLAKIKVSAPSPREQVVEAERGRVTPTTLDNLTRIVNDKSRGTLIRVRAANAILKIAYGEAENADG